MTLTDIHSRAVCRGGPRPLKPLKFTLTIWGSQYIFWDGESISSHISVRWQLQRSRDRKELAWPLLAADGLAALCVTTTLSTRTTEVPCSHLGLRWTNAHKWIQLATTDALHGVCQVLCQGVGSKRYSDRNQNIVPDHRWLHGTQLCVRDDSLAGHGLPGGKLFLSQALQVVRWRPLLCNTDDRCARLPSINACLEQLGRATFYQHTTSFQVRTQFNGKLLEVGLFSCFLFHKMTWLPLQSCAFPPIQN